MVAAAVKVLPQVDFVVVVVVAAVTVENRESHTKHVIHWNSLLAITSCSLTPSKETGYIRK